MTSLFNQSLEVLNQPCNTKEMPEEFKKLDPLLEMEENKVLLTDNNNGITKIINEDIIEDLIFEGVDINEVDKNGMTSLHHAAKLNKWHNVKCLVEKGADINIADKSGMTSLHHAVKANKKDMVLYLVEKGAKIKHLGDELKDDLLKHVVGNDADHKAFYIAIGSGNLELLETLINRRLSDYGISPDTRQRLDDLLATTYGELKLKNVPLSKEMEFFVEDSLINLRFFIKKNDQNTQEVKALVDNVTERIKMLCEQINQLQKRYSGEEGKEVDGEFILIARFVAKNIHILKRQLKSTYIKLPWEEMEFCVVNFISSHRRHQESDVAYKLVVDKTRLLNHLNNFAERLNKTDIKKDVNSQYPKQTARDLSARDSAIKAVIASNSLFQDLYDDYEIIKNVYSLKRIESYTNLSLSIDLNKEPDLGKLVIERTLQVIGESLKNTLQSPNISYDVHKMLLNSAPKHLREIITLLRDSLSHAHTLTKKIELEKSEDLEFFSKVRNDIKKVQVEIIDILYKKKVDVVKTFLNKIINSESLVDVKKLVNTLDEAKLEEINLGESNIQEIAKIKELVEKLSSEIKDKTKEEQSFLMSFNEIKEIF